MYPFSHNHGSVENHLIERKLILEGPIFHVHDYGRKGTSQQKGFIKHPPATVGGRLAVENPFGLVEVHPGAENTGLNHSIST